MRIIKLDATDSTNDYLKRLGRSESLADFTVVTAGNQLQGRGQRGAMWKTQPDKNLTFSVLKTWDCLTAKDAFLVNVGVSVALYRCLSALEVPKLSLKWPNDILSGSSKLCGILIENSLNGSRLTDSIIGIGLNVNQFQFDARFRATSLAQVLDRALDLDKLLEDLVHHLRETLPNLETDESETFWRTYETSLFGRNQENTFTDTAGRTFLGRITGVSRSGRLQIAMENGNRKEFDLKEVRLHY